MTVHKTIHTNNGNLHRFVYKNGAAPRKTAVTCNSHHHQGISLSADSKARIDFEKTCGTDLFCNSVPCCVVKIDPHEKTRENGRFRKISPVFSTLHFFEKIPIHFAIFSDREDPNPRKRDFQKKRNRIEQPKGLEPATRFQPFRLFCCFHGMFTNRRLQNKSLGVG